MLFNVGSKYINILIYIIYWINMCVRFFLFNRGRQKKSSAMPSVQAVIDGNYMMKAEKEKTAS